MPDNIFLDFLNRDSRELYGLTDRSKREHVAALVEAINVAVFLCDEYCVIPPGFIAECQFAQSALARVILYFAEGLIRPSMRENSIDLYFDKKQEEYREHRERYKGLFNPKMRDLCRRYCRSILPRAREIGNSLVDKWEAGPDSTGFFREVMERNRLDNSTIEAVRNIPRDLRGEGMAVTWEAINARVASLRLPPNSKELRHVVQHLYFVQYLKEHGLAIVTGLPFAKYDFGLGRGSFKNDYQLLKHALAVFGCWPQLMRLPPGVLYDLRFEEGYQRFRNALTEFGSKAASMSDARLHLSTVGTRVRQQLKRFTANENTAVAVYDQRAAARSPLIQLTTDQIEATGELLRIAAEGIQEFSNDPPRTGLLLPTGYGGWTSAEESPVAPAAAARPQTDIAIFCALREERKILVRRWNFGGDGDYWSGKIGDAECMLYTADRMGRVPAAIATMQYLGRYAPKVIVILGIAGGFEEEDVGEGHVIIPSDIADLASRKLRDEEDHVDPEFRPQPFEVNQKLVRFFNTPQFKQPAWEAVAQEEAEWPDGLRPMLHVGVTLACSDEVVSSTQWNKKLREAWPKLKGVEMEAGGVCPAAREHHIPVYVMRGVSDLANPLKSDNEWRARAMKTVATLFEQVVKQKVIP